ncbi:hypothetical protein BpHYR1_001209 [Brachionus plicatilis]|uniref:Uncharacterized protein n=1 Tax=Brachionus plicatilis TaxID=10195 RepID=A0A3M7T1C8_BRAPC|nr:hypothetical protein BpHYR1_001209 [Brachionus plicatilis]
MISTITKKHVIIFFISILSLVFLIHQFNKSRNILQSINDKQAKGELFKEFFLKSDDKYLSKCVDLFKKLRYPNTSLIIRPPPRKPPADMMDDFTMNGKMPITGYLYFNEAYLDSNSDNRSVISEIISENFYGQLKKVRNNQGLNYGDKVLNQMMHSYAEKIKNKFVVVIGTQLQTMDLVE